MVLVVVVGIFVVALVATISCALTGRRGEIVGMGVLASVAAGIYAIYLAINS